MVAGKSESAVGRSGFRDDGRTELFGHANKIGCRAAFGHSAAGQDARIVRGRKEFDPAAKRI